jgi:flagellar hook assembly protein FlgD
VRSLALGTLEAGIHAVVWDGRDDQGTRVANGVYLYRLSAGDTVTGRSLVVQR